MTDRWRRRKNILRLRPLFVVIFRRATSAGVLLSLAPR
jgi:hypothetical protein